MNGDNVLLFPQRHGRSGSPCEPQVLSHEQVDQLGIAPEADVAEPAIVVMVRSHSDAIQGATFALVWVIALIAAFQLGRVL